LFGTAARTFTRDLAIGESVGAATGAVIGALVAPGATAASDTYPFAGQVIPSGIVAGGIIGAAEALSLEGFERPSLHKGKMMNDKNASTGHLFPLVLVRGKLTLMTRLARYVTFLGCVSSVLIPYMAINRK